MTYLVITALLADRIASTIVSEDCRSFFILRLLWKPPQLRNSFSRVLEDLEAVRVDVCCAGGPDRVGDAYESQE